MNKVDQIRLELNKHKSSKNSAKYKKALDKMACLVEKETNQENTYLKHGEVVFLEDIQVTQDLKKILEDTKYSLVDIMKHLPSLSNDTKPKLFPLIYHEVTNRNCDCKAKFLKVHS